jgi:hypothetical protein
MDIDISDDLQNLRQRLEAVGYFNEASIVTRAALEIARLRGGDDPAFKPTLTAPREGGSKRGVRRGKVVAEGLPPHPHAARVAREDELIRP